MDTAQDPMTPPPAATWRFKVGVGIICLMLGSWLMVPLAAALDVPGSKVAALTGVLFISNKVLLLLVIAVMGKAGFAELKRTIGRHVSGMLPTPVAEVSPLRHRVGVVMFCLPLLTSFLEPYFDNFWPGLRPNLWQLQLLGDLMFVGSFFVLGGNFWDKAHALFMRKARVVVAD
ncbi:cytochrome C biogenesis protein cycl [Pseudomonas sp. Seg1]|uniref:transporter suffix domain-containing protein n=1 Tax=Pseudomonas sp. Seg1 TaxID=2678259 RepID=UPI001BB42555|nr:transporter suffix domain-containing protein [Pseudomonas sp. Seg1]BBP71488.1 cytochrome C biogenesis protein cycl [Pseudomonas sp. Seg1]